jgi:hypothetical protein
MYQSISTTVRCLYKGTIFNMDKQPREVPLTVYIEMRYANDGRQVFESENRRIRASVVTN